MRKSAHIHLPDGRQLEYVIRSTPRSKNLHLKITMREGLTVTAPVWLSLPKIMALVARKGDWIAARLTRFDEERRLLDEAGPGRPEIVVLPALAETWQVEYRPTQSKTVGARTVCPGKVLVYGAAEDDEHCQAALRRWLARRAKEALGPWLATLSAETGLPFSRLTIKNQRTRWGSCSGDNGISLNCKLLFLPWDLVRYVLVHELCHAQEHNHTHRYWSFLRQCEPDSDALHSRMRKAWQQIPAWAHPVRNGGRTR